MATADDASDNYPVKVPELTAVQAEVNGTTVMAEYAVVGSTLLLTSSIAFDTAGEFIGAVWRCNLGARRWLTATSRHSSRGQHHVPSP